MTFKTQVAEATKRFQQPTKPKLSPDPADPRPRRSNNNVALMGAASA
jgi:hypothetical protein